MKTPKYPRIMVSGERHNALMVESKSKKISLAELAEQRFVATDAKPKKGEK